jgi:hypothetical protein
VEIPIITLVVAVVEEDQVVLVVQLAVEDLQQEHLLVNQLLQVMLQPTQGEVVVAEECLLDKVEMVVAELFL